MRIKRTLADEKKFICHQIQAHAGEYLAHFMFITNGRFVIVIFDYFYKSIFFNQKLRKKNLNQEKLF